MESTQLRKLSTPSPLPAKRAHLLARSNSRSKGINFNTVTPSPLKAMSPRQGSNRKPSTEVKSSPYHFHTANAGHSIPAASAPLNYDLQYDFVLPLAEQLRGLDLDEQLRLLALKEMNVVEIKDGISRLKGKLDQTESDLRQLREIIQRSLYKEMNVHRPAKSLLPRHANLKPHSSARQGRKRAPSGPHTPRIFSESKENQPPPADRLSKLWSSLSKPMSFIQQIDSMLLNEFEKSLTGEPQMQTMLESMPSNQQAYDSDPSPLKDKSNYNTSQATPKQYYLQTLHSSGVPDDMFQAVSSSLWSFMNDMKQNMLATLNEQTDSAKGTTDEQTQEAPLIDLNSSPKSDHELTSPVANLDMNDEELSDDEVDLTMYSSMRRKKNTE